MINRIRCFLLAHDFSYINGWLVCNHCLELRDFRWLEEQKEVREPLVSKRGQGAIYEAPLDIDLARQEIIDQNNEEGRETKLSELDDDYE